MKANENQNIPKTTENSPVDRVILGKAEAKLLSKWVEDFNKKTDGLVKVSKADIVNFLIANHSSQLSAEETLRLANCSFDEARWLGWAMAKLKAAKKTGENLNFDQLTEFRNSLLSLSRESSTKKKPIKKDSQSELHDQTSKQEVAHKAKQASLATDLESTGGV